MVSFRKVLIELASRKFSFPAVSKGFSRERERESVCVCVWECVPDRSRRNLSSKLVGIPRRRGSADRRTSGYGTFDALFAAGPWAPPPLALDAPAALAAALRAAAGAAVVAAPLSLLLRYRHRSRASRRVLAADRAVRGGLARARAPCAADAVDAAEHARPAGRERWSEPGVRDADRPPPAKAARRRAPARKNHHAAPLTALENVEAEAEADGRSSWSGPRGNPSAGSGARTRGASSDRKTPPPRSNRTRSLLSLSRDRPG